MNNKIEKLLSYKGIQAEEMPQIPLYMDQLLGFFEEYFKDLKVNDEDKLLTKTMINNYVKAGVINPPQKKKYTKEQLMVLNLIVQMKNILSINELKIFLDHYKDEDEKVQMTKVLELYENFKSEENTHLSRLKEETDSIDLNLSHDNEEVWNLILSLIIESSVKKRLAEMLLDQVIVKPVPKNKKDKNRK